jgi:hypothetical protein
MFQKFRANLSRISNENGLTLVEVLAATFIFILIVIPLSGIYLSGAKTYMKTEAQSNLRSELDYVVADIMKKVQDASYFDLVDTGGEDKDSLYTIFSSQNSSNQNSNPVFSGNKDDLKKGIAVFKINVGYNEKPVSSVTRDVYEFQPDTSSPQSDFNYNHDKYFVFGLFKLGDDTSTNSTDLKTLTMYLLIAPKSDQPLIVDGKPTSFRSLDEIKTTILNGNPPFDYIRIVKTQMTVNNLRQGYLQ